MISRKKEESIEYIKFDNFEDKGRIKRLAYACPSTGRNGLADLRILSCVTGIQIVNGSVGSWVQN